MRANDVGVRRKIRELLAARRDEQTRFLAELVKVPSDNPPGDCAPHAARAAQLLEALGFKVERHVVPGALVSANGMLSCTNLVVRERFGEPAAAGHGPTIACNAHGAVHQRQHRPMRRGLHFQVMQARAFLNLIGRAILREQHAAEH